MQHALYHFSLPIFSSSFPFPFCAWKEWQVGGRRRGRGRVCPYWCQCKKDQKVFLKRSCFPREIDLWNVGRIFLFLLFIWQCLCGIVGFHAIFKNKRKPTSWIWRVWFSLANRKRGGASISISSEIIIWEKGWVRRKKGSGEKRKIPFRSGGTLMVLFLQQRKKTKLFFTPLFFFDPLFFWESRNISEAKKTPLPQFFSGTKLEKTFFG